VKRLVDTLKRPTLRVRLTMMYGATFLAAGVLLVAVMYLLVRDRLGQPGSAGRVIVSSTFGGAAGAGTIQTQPPVTEKLSVDGPTLQRVTQDVQHYFDATMSSLLWRSSVVLALAAVVAIGLGWLMAGRALRPLHQVTDTARRVSDRGLHERIAMQGPDDEIKELADTFDAMLDRLDRAFDGQRRFVGNASHELRTPLAIQRTLLEVSASDPGAGEDVRRLTRPLLATNERSERLIDGLLLLAQSEQELHARELVDLGAVTDDVVLVVTSEAAARDITIRAQTSPTIVDGDPVLLEHLVMNLCHNAVRHNVDGGSINVTCRPAGDEVVLSVANTGAEIAGRDVGVLFEPFRRGRDRVGGERGSGLGLSIVRAVAYAHGGRVTASARPGGGLIVEVRLPHQLG
jgi:signal transduction histidine kinase